MIRLLTFLVLVVTYISCADHEIYKNCSRIPFCTKLRDFKPSSVYFAQVEKLIQKENAVIIPLSNSDNQELNLQITLLENNIARVKIAEKDSSRYELADVLVKEPNLLEVSIETSNNGVTIVPKDQENYNHKVIVTSGTPFNVEFYYDDTMHILLDGERLYFDTEFSTSKPFTFSTDFVDSQRMYGLYHHTVKLELPPTKNLDGSIIMDPYRNRNADNANYEVDSPMAIYGAVPLIYGHSEKHTSGIFLHNAAEQWVDIWYNESYSGHAYFMVESATLDLFVLLAGQPKDVVRQFTGLTGVAHMPQLWTLGYHQSRWTYTSQEDTKEVVAKMDANDFQMDAIWLDIDYTDEKKYFTWNPDTFPDPIELQANLSATNRKLVTILDSHFKVDESYELYNEAKDKYFIKWDNQSDFQADCWPGLSSYLDFMNPKIRDFYAGWYSYEKYKGSTPTLAGVWNDMNEPSVFIDELEKTLPFEIKHFGGVEHRDVHNIYGLLHVMATHQGLMQRDNGTKRPFILTRSHFAGSQRYAAMWTGDNTAGWPYLQVTYAECLLSNIVGHVFCGADVGGFFDNPSVELAQRWYQAGIWLPFYRSHSADTTDRREPYLYSESDQEVIRNAIRIRYRHIPVWYTLFYEHTRTGDPVIKPIFYDYPGTVDQDYHLLLGSNILARPVMEENAKVVTVNFPGDKYNYWYRVDDNSFKVFTGETIQQFDVTINTSPYFYRGGSIIATKEDKRRSTSEMQTDPITLYINLDSKGRASGTLYVDDYESFQYQDNQLYFYVNITYIPETRGILVQKIDGDNSGFTVNIRKIIINQKSSTGTNKYLRSTYSSLSDGKKLSTINWSDELTRNNYVFIKL